MIYPSLRVVAVKRPGDGRVVPDAYIVCDVRSHATAIEYLNAINKRVASFITSKVLLASYLKGD